MHCKKVFLFFFNSDFSVFINVFCVDLSVINSSYTDVVKCNVQLISVFYLYLLNVQNYNFSQKMAVEDF